MVAADSFEDIYKKLCFGVKRTQRFAQNKANHEASLRLRVLPEEGIKTKPSKPQKDDVAPHQDEELTGVQLFSQSSAPVESTMKKQKKDDKPDDKAQRMQTERVQHLRKLNRMFTWGDNIPEPFINFSDLELPKQFLVNLESFGISEPTPIQMQSVPIMMQRRDVLASAPTGSGKTLAFILPLVLELTKIKNTKKEAGMLALVLEPTKVLAKQTHTQFVKFCHKLPLTCATLSEEDIVDQADVIVTTPNKLIFALENNEQLRDRIQHLRWLIVDESDRLFDNTESGDRNFRQQLGKIYQSASGTLTRRAFFSATFSYEVEEWCKENLTDCAMVCIGARNSANTSVTQELVFAGSEQGKVAAIQSLIRSGFEPPALVFVQSKERAGQLYAELSSSFRKMPIRLISSEVEEKEQNSTLDKLRTGEVWLVVCTEMLGRGLDIPGVNLVVNFDLPTSIVNYIHRIGRTGRAGRSGRAVTYFTESDMDIIRPVATVISQAGFDVPEYTLRLNKVAKKKRKTLLKKAPTRQHFGSVQKWKRLRKIGAKKHELKPERKLKKKKKKPSKTLPTSAETLKESASVDPAEKKTSKKRKKQTSKTV